MSKGKFAIFGVVLTTLMVVVESDFTFTEEENIVIRKFSPIKQHPRRPAVTPTNGCDCTYEVYDCGCCVHMEIDQIDLNDTGCVNVTYLPDQYGISLTFSLDGKVLLNETVSAINPPPICFGVPYLHDILSLCIDFYNLVITGTTFSGCITLEASIYGILSDEWDLGCFKIGYPYSKKMLGVNVLELKEWLRELSIEQQKQREKLMSKSTG